MVLSLAGAADTDHERGAAGRRRQAECRRSETVCRSHDDGAGQTDLQRRRRADVSVLRARRTRFDRGDPERRAARFRRTLERGQGGQPHARARAAQEAADVVECDRLGQSAGVHALCAVAAGAAYDILPCTDAGSIACATGCHQEGAGGIGCAGRLSRGGGVNSASRKRQRDIVPSVSRAALPAVATCYCPVRAGSIAMRAPTQKLKTEVTIAMKDFAGKFAVITGGGTGMGRELARQLVAEGCNVAMCDVSVEAMAETKRMCEAEKLPQGLRVTTHVADVSIENHLQRFRDELIEQQATDKIHLLFNNAGIGGGGSLFTNTREQWERTFNICWGGVYLGVRTFLPLMMKADEAHIVNTSSVNGFWASVGTGASHTAYSAAKFAVKGFTEALMTDLRLNAPHIKCSVVMPGHIGTSIVS